MIRKLVFLIRFLIFVWLSVLQRNLVVHLNKLVGAFKKLLDMERGEISVVVKVFQDLLDKLNIVTGNRLDDRFLSDLVFDLLDTVLIGEHLLLNPVWVVRNDSSQQVSEDDQEVLNDKDCDDELRPCRDPCAIS